MKTWTVVIEITDTAAPQYMYDQRSIEQMVSDALRFQTSLCKFRIMETIEAPYGSQKPGGVFLSEGKVKP